MYPLASASRKCFVSIFQPLHDVEGWACVARTLRRAGDVFHFVFDAFTLFFGIYLFLDISLAHKTYTKLRRSTSPIPRPEDYLAESGLRHQIACSNHSLSMLANPVFLVSHLVFVFQCDAERHPTDILFSTIQPGHPNGIVQTHHPLVVQTRTPGCCCSHLRYPMLEYERLRSSHVVFTRSLHCITIRSIA